MPAFLNFRIRDFSDEYSDTRVEINDITGVNYDGDIAQTIGTGARAELQNAIEAVTLGNLATYSAVSLRETVNDERPASAFAQVETGLRMYGRSASGKLYTLTVAAPDLSAIAVAGQDEVDLGAAPVSALVGALESHWTPEGNAVTIEKGVIVGRAR